MLFLIGLLQLLSLHLVPHPRSSLKCNKKSKVLPQGEKKLSLSDIDACLYNLMPGDAHTVISLSYPSNLTRMGWDLI